jgi:hypothetical protein
VGVVVSEVFERRERRHCGSGRAGVCGQCLRGRIVGGGRYEGRVVVMPVTGSAVLVIVFWAGEGDLDCVARRWERVHFVITGWVSWVV